MKKFTFIILILLIGCKKENQDFYSNNDYGTGAILDTTTNFETVDIPSGSGNTSLPNSFDLSYLMPPIRHQKSQLSCVGFCLASLKSFHEKLEKGYSYTDNSKIMSPSFIYNQVGICDKGTSTIKALNFLKSKGVCTESEFPYDEFNCTNIPNSSIIANAYKNRIRDWLGFDFRNKSKNTILYEMKYYLNEMQPIVVDVQVDNNFYQLGFNDNNEVTWNFNLSLLDDYHCMLIVGYDDSKGAFKVWNSWGSDWGNNGWIWIDYNMFFRNVRYAFVTWDIFDNSNQSTSISVSGNLNFGNTQINTTKNNSITITNTGTTSITINSIQTPNGYYINQTFPVTLTQNQNITFSLYFGPTSVISYNGSLNIICNPSTANKSVNIQGSGINNCNLTMYCGPWTGCTIPCNFPQVIGNEACNGTPPYLYKLDNGNWTSSYLFTVNQSGNYTITVKDSNGCTTTKSWNL